MTIMKTAHEVLKALMRTEKSTGYEPQGKYLFLVDMDCNKTQIKKAVEQVYKVKVTSVNTLVAPGKKRRVRYQVGKTPDFKKAVVTLQAGQKIEVS